MVNDDDAPVPAKADIIPAAPRPRGKSNRRSAPARPAVTKATVPGAGRTAVVEPAQADLARQLQGMVGLIMEADQRSRDAEEAKELMVELMEKVGSLPDEAFRILSGNDDVQRIFQRIATASEAKPGDAIFDINGRQIGIVPFTYEDFCEMYEMYEWTPLRTNNSISVNGVAIAVFEGQKIRTPKCFYDVEMESYNAMRTLHDPNRILAGATQGAADGFTVSTGWQKDDAETLVRKYGVER